MFMDTSYIINASQNALFHYVYRYNDFSRIIM